MNDASAISLDSTPAPQAGYATTPAHADSSYPSAARLGMLLFLATEVMFFLGLIAAYIVIRAGSPDLFASQSHTLNRIAASINTGILIASSIVMAMATRAARAGNAKRTAILLLATFALGGVFLGIKGYEYRAKLNHFTVFAREGANPRTATWFIYDGHRTAELTEADAEDAGRVRIKSWHIDGRRREVARKEPIDVHAYTAHLDPALQAAAPGSYDIAYADVLDFTAYGPQKNIFFSCYYVLTGAHALHIIGGMIAIALLLLGTLRGQTFPIATANVGLYWQFVDVVWLILFPLLYLI